MLPELFGIPTYLILAVLGFAAAFVLAMFRRNAYEYRVIDLVAMLCASIVGIVVGARLLFVITEIPALIDHNFSWEIIESRVINGGLVFYGGLIGALLCIYFLAKYLNLDTKKTLNFVCPCYTVFHAFGRIGCLLGGCCYGVASDVGVLMPHTLADGTVKYVTSVPVQLYEAIALVLITVILLLVEMDDIKRAKASNLLPLYIALYAPARFVLEMWRGDILRGVFDVSFKYATEDGRLTGRFNLSTSQMISLLLIIALLIYVGYKRALAKQAKKLVAKDEDSSAVCALCAEELPEAEEIKPFDAENAANENKQD